MSPWLSGLAGGVLIGIASSLLLWLNGRIAGISGIAYGVADRGWSVRGWRLAFLLGLLCAGGLAFHGMPHAEAREGFPRAWLIAAGLLVGIGTAMGSGCTSGHGVCGLARLSRRSLVAVGVFMATAFATAFAVRSLWGGLS